MGPSIVRPVAAQNVRHLDHGRGLQSVHQLVDGRVDGVPDLLGQVRIDGGGGGRGVAEDDLDDAQVDPGLQQMGGEGMSEGVDVGGFAHAALVHGQTEGPLQGAARDGAAVVLHAVGETVAGHGREEPEGRTVRGPELTESFEGFLRQGHETILTAFAVDVQELAGGIDLGDREAAALIETQAAGIDGGEADSIDGFVDAGQDGFDFLTAQDDGQFLGPGRTQQFEGGPVAPDGVLKEELDGAQGDGGGGAGDFLFQGEMEEVTAQFLLGDEIRRLVEIAGQAAHSADIAGLSFGGETMELHILQESSTQRCH